MLDDVASTSTEQLIVIVFISLFTQIFIGPHGGDASAGDGDEIREWAALFILHGREIVYDI